MFDWIGWLFDAKPFTPRGLCGGWTPAMEVVSQVQNGVIAAAYYLIPLCIAYVYRYRPDLAPSRWVVVCFVTFILSCGTGHLLDLMSFFRPMYRLNLLVDGVTAAASVSTAGFLLSKRRQAIEAPTQEQYRETVERLELEMTARKHFQARLLGENAELRNAAQDLRAEFETIRFKEGMDEHYRSMREKLHRVVDAASGRTASRPADRPGTGQN